MMKYIRSVKAIFAEPDWFKKIIIPGLFCLVPIFGLFHLLGWGAEVFRAIDRNADRILPEEKLSLSYLTDGIKLMVGILFYNVPAICFYSLHHHLETASGILAAIGKVSSLLMYGCIILFCFILPVILIAFIRFQYSRIFDFRWLFRVVGQHIHEELILFAFFCGLLVFSTLGASILVVGICVTLPIGLLCYLRIVGNSELFHSI